MKLPRWLMIILLTVIGFTVLVGTWAWWVTWPERTARRFVELLAADEFDDARRMQQNPENMRLVKGSDGEKEVDVFLFGKELSSRMLSLLPEYFELARISPIKCDYPDLVRGRRRFSVHGGIFDQMPLVEITAERGLVTIEMDNPEPEMARESKSR